MRPEGLGKLKKSYSISYLIITNIAFINSSLLSFSFQFLGNIPAPITVSRLSHDKHLLVLLAFKLESTLAYRPYFAKIKQRFYTPVKMVY
jgi:hypothetical protein